MSNVVRDIRICKRVLEGDSYSIIGRDNSISRTRVSQVFFKYMRKVNAYGYVNGISMPNFSKNSMYMGAVSEYRNHSKFILSILDKL